MSTGLYRFVSVCTSSFFNRIIVKDFRDLYPYSRNTGTKTVHQISIVAYSAVLVLKESFNSDAGLI